MPEVAEEVTRDDVIALPSTEESFNQESVPVLLEVVTERLRDYVQQQASGDEPVSLLGFAVELIYKTGEQDAIAEMRGRRRS
jgi:hypothetical protein